MKRPDTLAHTQSELGWVVHIYDRRRRLLCTLDPSHGWTFLVGLSLGLVICITGYSLTSNRVAPPPPAALPQPTAPLAID